MMRTVTSIPAISLAVILLDTGGLRAVDIKPDSLRCEYLVGPLGIDEENPRLSWQLESGPRGQMIQPMRITEVIKPGGITNPKPENFEGPLILAGNLEAWFYQTLAGINHDPEQPGFKHIILKPNPVGNLTEVHAWHQSMSAAAVGSWSGRSGNTWPCVGSTHGAPAPATSTRETRASASSTEPSGSRSASPMR